MLITQGGLVGGWAMYLENGRVIFDYNYGLVAHYRVSAELPERFSSLEARFAYDGKDGKPTVPAAP